LAILGHSKRRLVKRRVYIPVKVFEGPLESILKARRTLANARNSLTLTWQPPCDPRGATTPSHGSRRLAFCVCVVKQSSTQLPSAAPPAWSPSAPLSAGTYESCGLRLAGAQSGPSPRTHRTHHAAPVPHARRGKKRSSPAPPAWCRGERGAVGCCEGNLHGSSVCWLDTITADCFYSEQTGVRIEPLSLINGTGPVRPRVFSPLTLSSPHQRARWLAGSWPRRLWARAPSAELLLRRKRYGHQRSLQEQFTLFLRSCC